MEHIIYECGICDCYHPWNWDGDCRDDANRYGDPEEYAEKNNVDINDVEVRTMEERVEADEGGENEDTEPLCECGSYAEGECGRCSQVQTNSH